MVCVTHCVTECAVFKYLSTLNVTLQRVDSTIEDVSPVPNYVRVTLEFIRFSYDHMLHRFYKYHHQNCLIMNNYNAKGIKGKL